MDLTKLYDFIHVLIIKGRHPIKVIIFLSLIFFYDLFTTKARIKS
jgi:hypothetical protein